MCLHAQYSSILWTSVAAVLHRYTEKSAPSWEIRGVA
jgi:hypothetical protein